MNHNRSKGNFAFQEANSPISSHELIQSHASSSRSRLFRFGSQRRPNWTSGGRLKNANYQDVSVDCDVVRYGYGFCFCCFRPEMPFRDYIKNDMFTDEPKKLLKRDAQSYEEVRTGIRAQMMDDCLHSCRAYPSMAHFEFFWKEQSNILPMNVVFLFQANVRSDQPPDIRKARSFEEREEEYVKARNRIFNQDVRDIFCSLRLKNM